MAVESALDELVGLFELFIQGGPPPYPAHLRATSFTDPVSPGTVWFWRVGGVRR